jgi:hypothetical protein
MRPELHAGKLARAVLRGGGGGNTALLTRHRARDAAGQPGSPSLYVVRDRRYGWSWRCLSTNCAQSVGPMRHSFRLWQELLDVSVASAIVEARRRWAAAAGGAGSRSGVGAGAGARARGGAADETTGENTTTGEDTDEDG